MLNETPCLIVIASNIKEHSAFLASSNTTFLKCENTSLNKPGSHFTEEDQLS